MVEVSFIMISAFFSFFLGIGSYIMYPICRQDTIIAMLFGVIITYPFFRIAKYVIKKNKYEDIFELNKNIKGIGIFLNILLFIGLFVISLFLLYNISDFLNIEYFSESSVQFTKFLILIPLWYVLSKDLKTILKMNQVMAIVCVVILFIDFIGIAHKIDLSNVQPVMATDIKDFSKALLYLAGLNGAGVLMCALVGRKSISDNDSKIDKILNLFYIIANIMQIVIIASVILTQGINYVLLFRFPEYIALKQFSFLNMAERLENVLALQFYFNSISILSFLLHYIVKLLPKSNKIKIYPIFVLLVMYFLTCFIFKDTSYFTLYIQKYIVLLCYITIILPFFIDYIILHKKVNKNS